LFFQQVLFLPKQAGFVHVKQKVFSKPEQIELHIKRYLYLQYLKKSNSTSA